MTDSAALARLVEAARARPAHVVTADEAVAAIDGDPTPEAIADLRSRLAAEGIELDESSVEPVDEDRDETEIAVVVRDPLNDDMDDADDLVVRRSDRLRHSMKATVRMNLSSGTADPVKMYMREIGRVPLLTAQEEVALAKQIERGSAAAERLAELTAAGELGTLAPGEASRLKRLVRLGDDAKVDLTQANLRLVVSIAKRYVRGGSMQLLDLVQEGNLGLMRAVEKFDWSKGFKFSTYATWWIRQAITRAIADQERTIRIPVHMMEAINKQTRAARELAQELEREPTDEELAARLEWSVEKVRDLKRISVDSLSLDSPLREGEDGVLADVIEDLNSEAPVDIAERNMLTSAIEEALDDLNPRERDLLRMRFGLDDGLPRTLEEVGREFGVTRERIRQIETKTLAKLRNPQHSQKLRDYFDLD